MRLPAIVATALSLPLLAASPAAASGPTGPTEFERKLDQVPASTLDLEAPLLQYIDMDLVWERLGVGTDPQDRIDAIGRTAQIDTYAQPGSLFGSMALLVDEARSEVGFTITEIEREIAVTAPPRRVIVADASVAPETVVGALETDPTWSSDLELVEGADGTYYRWGEDGAEQDLTRRTPMRELGQGGQFAVYAADPTTVVRTIEEDDMTATQAAIAGVAPSLLDEGVFAAAAASIADGQVVQAFGIDEFIGADPVNAAPTITFQPYSGVLVVEIVRDGGYTTQIIVPHDSADAAAANAALAEQWLADGIDVVSARPISELLTGATVRVDGANLVIEGDAVGMYRYATRMVLVRALLPVA